LIIRDAVEGLSQETRCYFEHRRQWDYAQKPNDHFFETQFAVSRVWIAFVPEGTLSLGAIFYLQFYHGQRFVTPAMMYGSIDPGIDKSFDDLDKWALTLTRLIQHVEQGKDDSTLAHDGPLNYVTSGRRDCLSEARLVRVPLESITSRDDLQRIVIKPLAALVRGEVEEAKALLKDVETEQWPSHIIQVEDGVEETEQI
jgi:hypothetical protein